VDGHTGSVPRCRDLGAHSYRTSDAIDGLPAVDIPGLTAAVALDLRALA
jgi:hypothetical protein